MLNQLATTALLDKMEATLLRLATEHYSPPGSCCGCTQDVPTVGHHPTCHIAVMLAEIAELRSRAGKKRGAQRSK
jgi:hypothetical protein